MRIRSRGLNWMIAALVVTVCRVLFWTVRVRYLLGAPGTNPFASDCTRGSIFCVWHDSVTYPLFAGRHKNTVALVSRYQDGSLLVRGLKFLGIGVVRGSSGRSGAGAIRELLHTSPDVQIVVTPDGPRGPRRKTKPGLIFLASRSGRSIVPTAFCAKRSWTIKGNWTDLAIPKPFTTVYALSGAPIFVPEDATAEELAEKESLLQSEMDRITLEAEQRCQGIEQAAEPAQGCRVIFRMQCCQQLQALT